MAHILMLLWKHGRFQSPASPKFNITTCDSTRQNTWCYLRCMPIPPSIRSPRLNIFCIFCPVQLQMVIFEFEDERDWNRACCQSKIKMCTMCTFRRVQHPCQVSVALPHCWQRYSWFCVTPLDLHNRWRLQWLHLHYRKTWISLEQKRI